MLISEIIKTIVETHSMKLVRVNVKKTNYHVIHGNRVPIEYDCKDYEGSKRGWVVLDATTANAMLACYNALSAENKPKFDTIPLTKLVDFCWKHVS